MTNGLDLLGASIAVSKPKKIKAPAPMRNAGVALSAGARAVRAGKKIQKGNPKLSAAVIAAGNKALKVGNKKPAAPGTSAKVKSPVVTPPPGTSAAAVVKPPISPDTHAANAGPPVVQRPASAMHNAAPSPPSSAPARATSRRVRIHGVDFYLGVDAAGLDASDPAYDSLTDPDSPNYVNPFDIANVVNAAADVADFVGQIQDLILQLPAGSPLLAGGGNGPALLNDAEVFATPFANFVNGASNVSGPIIQNFIDNVYAPWKDAVTNGWMTRAQAAIEMAGGPTGQLGIAPSGITIGPGGTQQFTAGLVSGTLPAVSISWSCDPAIGTIDRKGLFTAGQTPGTGQVTAKAGAAVAAAQVTVQAGASTTPTPTGIGQLASIVVTPQGMTVPPGTPQMFSAQALDASGQPLSPQPSFAWSVLPAAGAFIDPTGNLTVQTPGVYTVSAAVRTAAAGSVIGTATVNVSAAIPAADPSGGYGGGSGGGGGGGSGGYDDGGGEEERPYDGPDYGMEDASGLDALGPHYDEEGDGGQDGDAEAETDPGMSANDADGSGRDEQEMMMPGETALTDDLTESEDAMNGLDLLGAGWSDYLKAGTGLLSAAGGAFSDGGQQAQRPVQPQAPPPPPPMPLWQKVAIGLGSVVVVGVGGAVAVKVLRK